MSATITVNRNELASALTFAQLGLSRRPAVPVLAGMLVTISCGTLELAAFDYDTAARAKVSGQASGPGSVLVNGSDLAVAVKSLPKGKKVTAELSIVPGTSPDGEAITLLVIESEGLQASVSSLPMGEYPQLPAMPELSGYADGELFARSVARVGLCAGRDDTLPVLLCVNITSDRGSLELAATDRYRLGVDRLHWTGPDGVSAIVPAVTLGKFARAADKTGKVALHFGAGHAGFSDGTRSLIVSAFKAEGREFPKFRGLIRPASDDTTTVLVVAAALEAAVTRAGKLTGRGERTEFSIGPDSITVRAMRDGQVVGSQTVPAVTEGPDLETGFNADCLASVLAGADGEAMIGFVNANKPAQVTSGDFTGVCMPIRKAQ